MAGASVIGALGTAALVWLWTQWLGSFPPADQFDAHISWSHLGHGILGLISSVPLMILNVSLWHGSGLFLLWLTAVFGWGSCVRRLWGDTLRRDEGLLMEFGAGILILGLLITLLGLCGAFRRLSFDALLVIGWGSVITQILSSRRRLISFKQLPSDFRGTIYYFTILLVSLYLIIGALYALTPPMQSDGMRYHLAAIQEWLRRGRICYLPLNAFSNFPFLGEMHFVYGVAYGAPEVAQLIHYAFFVACGLVLRALARRILVEHGLRWSSTTQGSLLAWLPAWLYWTTPANAIVAAWPFIDQAVNFYWVLAAFAAILAADSMRRRSFVLLGFFLGACLSAKYTSIGFAALLLFALLLSVIMKPRCSATTVGEWMRGTLIAMNVTLLVSAIWYVKNWYFTGNPLYPLAGSIFGYGEFGSENTALYARKMAEKGVAKNFINLVLSPLHVTFHWTRFEHHFLDGHALIAPLLAMGAVVACRRPRIRGLLLLPLILGAGIWAMWFASYQSNRMLGGALAFFMAIAPLGLAHVARSGVLWRAGVLGVLLSCVHGACYVLQYETVIHRPSIIHYLSGKTSRDEYLAEALNYYRAFRWLEQHAAPDAKVLLIGEHRAFYAKFEPVGSDWYDTPAVLAIIRSLPEKSLDGLVSALRQRGITWVLVNDAELAPQFASYWRPRFRDDEWSLIQQFLDSPPWQKYHIAPGVTVFSLDGRQAQGRNTP